jgi:hypothetical protein
VPKFDHVTRESVEVAIRDAFADVRLGEGISLRWAEAIDDMNDQRTPTELNALRRSEVTDDWAAVPASELDSAFIAHLDAEGLRYYLPALMLRLLDNYEAAELWSIGTIVALDQRERHPPGFLELLTESQRTAVALYVRALPDLVDLHRDDAALITRAFRAVWSRELAEDA